MTDTTFDAIQQIPATPPGQLMQLTVQKPETVAVTAEAATGAAVVVLDQGKPSQMAVQLARPGIAALAQKLLPFLGESRPPSAH